MKFFYRHKKALIILFAVAAYAVILLSAPKLIRIPGTISYTASTQKQAVEDSYQQTIPLYSSAKEITQDGPYLIRLHGENVYIFSGDKCLYRVKTTTSQFSVQDAESVLTGLEISDKAVLLELIEYIES